MIQARLAQPLAAATLGTSRANWYGGGMPFVSFGYRGEQGGFGLGPVVVHSESDTGASSSIGATLIGLTLHAEIDAMHSADHKNGMYLLAGVSVMLPWLSSSSNAIGTASRNNEDGISGKAAYGALLGLGGRHWVSRNLGVNVEIGESYANTPIGTSASAAPTVDVTTTQPTDLRAGVLTTFGAVGVTLVF